MANKNKKAFTLVELLAVIVILAVILVIAVPQIMDTIKESRKGALISSAKLIASSAETAYISNQTLGIEKAIECEDVSNYNSEDYTSCSIKFVDGKAKVTIVGQGKFEGMAVCRGTKEEAEVEEPIGGKCLTPFEKDTWATIKAAVTAGDTSKYNVGDIKKIYLGEALGIHTVRIANTTPCDGTLESETACGFVIEFADMITTYAMNSSMTNAGGWPASAMHAYVNGYIYNVLPEEVKSVIIKTKVVSGHGSGDTNNFESEDYLYLLSTREVYGKEGTSNTISNDTADGDTITRQLDYYKYNNVSTSSFSGAIKKNESSDYFWWLRSSCSNYTISFYRVDAGGCWDFDVADSSIGVSPAFRLG